MDKGLGVEAFCCKIKKLLEHSIRLSFNEKFFQQEAKSSGCWNETILSS